ncbi:MAG: CRISPR-associated helicase Cas3', partial [Myxococcales bacterium]|nr:CRISPR-associated helicase Cas3' [Myxococcales bacterium]
MHFAWLHNDALWVFDETQLMGVGVETSAQLDAFRKVLGTAKPSPSIWMSATLGERQIETVDHARPEGGWRTLRLGADDFAVNAVIQRTGAKKQIASATMRVDKDSSRDVAKRDAKSDYAQGVASRIAALHQQGTLTLVIVNRVTRAQAIYAALRAAQPQRRIALLHSRFRPGDRRWHAETLTAHGDRIVVSTQVVEAGVDISARTLLTELAPWSSLVQRFGRCNRYGEYDEATIEWIDVVAADEKDQAGLPYDNESLDVARGLVSGLTDAGPTSLARVAYEPPLVIRPVIRRKDLVELFDTTPDLAGNDLDVSRYVRDETNDTDVSVFWRDLEEPDESTPEPASDELCSVTLKAASDFIGKKTVTAWVFDSLDQRWAATSHVRPGQTLLLCSAHGGYDTELGFTGEPAKKGSSVPVVGSAKTAPAAMDSDGESIARWLS